MAGHAAVRSYNHSFQAGAASTRDSVQALGCHGKIMKFRFSVAIAVFLLPASLSADNLAHEVPDQFLGDWGTSFTDCGTEADDTTLHIGMRHISYGERSGMLQAVVVRGTKEVALIAEFTSEGEAWLDASTFVLSPDGEQLTQSAGVNGEPLVRVRCDSMLGSSPNIHSSDTGLSVLRPRKVQKIRR